MKPLLIVLIGLTLAACGADGEPIYPSARSEVSLSNHGVSVGTRVAATRGPVTISVGVGL
ncbi:MAG: hypothetical protein ACSHWS_05885 [Sulfitobacter sp.]